LQSGEPFDELSIDVLIDYEEEELFALLGQWALGEGLGIRPRDLGQLVRKGREWLEDNTEEMRKAVCNAPVVVATRAEASTGAIMDAATLADLMAAHFGKLPASVAAVIIVHRGLDWLCR
jgi:hypothetical protein